MEQLDGYGHPSPDTQASKPVTDEPPHPGYPLGFIIVGLSGTGGCFLFSNWDGVSWWAPLFMYVLPVILVLSFAWWISRNPVHTKGDKRNLWLFLLTCYILAAGPFAMSDLLSTNVNAHDGLNGDIPPDHVTIILTALPFVLPGVLAGLYFISRAPPDRRPVPYAAFVAAFLILLVFFVPFPNRLGANEMPDTEWNVFGDDDEYLYVAPLWHYYLTRHEVGFIAIVIQSLTAIFALMLGSLWSLLRPEEFRGAFGIPPRHDEPPLDGGPPIEREPPLRLFEG